MNNVVAAGINKKTVLPVVRGYPAHDGVDGVERHICSHNAHQLVLMVDRRSDCDTHAADQDVHIWIRNNCFTRLLCRLIPATCGWIVPFRCGGGSVRLGKYLVGGSDIHIQQLRSVVSVCPDDGCQFVIGEGRLIQTLDIIHNAFHHGPFAFKPCINGPGIFVGLVLQKLRLDGVQLSVGQNHTDAT